MASRIKIDRAGRVVIPKPVRSALRLSPGDDLELESTGEQLTLRPVRDTLPLTKERGVWVYRSGRPAKDVSIAELIELSRQGRYRDLTR